MEEADKILIPLLQQIGCPLPPDCVTVSQIAANADAFLPVVIHLFKTIDKMNGGVLPRSVASGAAARFKLANQLVQMVTALGHKGNLQFNLFLYPEDKGVRELLAFLASKLPRSDDQADDDAADASGATGGPVSITKLMGENLTQWTARQWSVLTSEGATSTFVSTVPLALPSVEDANKDAIRYATYFQPLLSTQCTRPQLAPSLFELNARDVVLTNEADREFEDSKDIGLTALRAKRAAGISALVNSAFRGAARMDAGSALDSMRSGLMAMGKADTSASSLYKRREEFTQESAAAAAPPPKAADNEKKPDEETEEQQKAKLEAEVERLNAMLRAVTGQLNDLERKADEAQASLGPMTSEASTLSQQNAKIAEENKGKSDALSLLPEADKNVAELTRISEASAKRLLDLGEEWEKYRLPLVNQFRYKKQLLNERKDEVGTKLEQMKRMREEMKALASTIREREEHCKAVTDELNKLPKAINRQVYVQRIMNIVKNLEKQKQEIASVLADVRRLQRDINSVTETLQRSFAIADEVVFSVAAEGAAGKRGDKDPTAVQAYKNVVALRSGFEKLVQMVADTGRAKNEVLDVVTRIEHIEARNSALNMERIAEDLASVRNENKQLTAKLKELKARVQK